MPHYFFEVKNGHSLASGLDCANDSDAIDKATIIARQIARMSVNQRSEKLWSSMPPGRN